MAIEIFSWIAVAAILMAAIAAMIGRDWRVSLGALGLQYLAAFWLITRHLPFVMGSAKLITGWMVVAVLGMTRLGLTSMEEVESSYLPRGRSYRVILICIVAFVAAGASSRIEAALPGIGVQVITGSLLLIGAGLLHLGISPGLLNTALGLLTMLVGFEVIYAAVESSILVAGLLAIVNMGLGLTGAYLLLAGNTIHEEEGDVL